MKKPYPPLLNNLPFSEVFHWKVCDFLKAPIQGVPNFPESWMYPRDSILQPLFDTYWIELIEFGIFDGITRKYQTPEHLCLSDDTEAVNFSFVLLLFIILSVGICGSLIIFTLEMLKFKSNKWFKI